MATKVPVTLTENDQNHNTEGPVDSPSCGRPGSSGGVFIPWCNHSCPSQCSACVTAQESGSCLSWRSVVITGPSGLLQLPLSSQRSPGPEEGRIAGWEDRQLPALRLPQFPPPDKSSQSLKGFQGPYSAKTPGASLPGKLGRERAMEAEEASEGENG